jgi:hypothetical protein
VLLVIALLLAGLVAQRRALTERAIVRWLAAQGITASPRISGFGFGGLELHDLSIGARPEPGLGIARVEVRWSAGSLVGRRATSVDVFGARMRLSWTAGRVSAGPLDVFLGRPATRDGAAAPPLPVDAVRFHDVRIDLRVPAGTIAARGDIEVTVESLGTRGRAALRATTPWGPMRLAASGELPSGGTHGRRWRADVSSSRLEMTGMAQATGIAVRARGTGSVLHARFAAERASASGTPPPLETVRVTGTLGGAFDRLALDATAATIDDPLLVAVTGTIEPFGNRFDLAVRLPETRLDGMAPGRLMPVLAGTISELKGTLAADGWARYREGALNAQLALAFRDVDVVAGLGTVRALNGVVTLLGPPAVRTPPGQMIAMAGVDAALPLEAGEVRFQLEPGAVVRLERAAWRLANGTLHTAGRLPLTADERALTLEASDLDLGTLLASLAFEGISGSGTLSGTIPVRQRGHTLTIEHGRLEATSPGTLKYQRPNAAAATGNRQLDLLLAVLSDFRYDELSLTLDGDTDAPMQMALHIRGRNPAYERGRPVVFNVTVEAPLAGLVRTARCAYRVPEAIEKQLDSMGIRGTK